MYVCPLSICLSSHSAFLPFTETFIKCIVSFWQPETQYSVYIQGVYVLSVFLVSRETDVCGREPGPHGTIFIPDHNFTKICLEICGWPKGHWHNPSCQLVSFCAAFLWSLLHSCVRNVRSSGFNCLSSGHHSPLSLQFSWEFLLWPLISLCYFTAEMYLLFSIFCNICIGHHIC